MILSYYFICIMLDKIILLLKKKINIIMLLSMKI